ncbi:hypothetical protein BDZ88DRAFT_417686 [Geranomyces variabilis]|nr:hypothetical protein BDZ88DRAFT_417686 [Geranomyces variabilis]KAJ3138352.1 hypothetical protein HDU90_001315 [Geranomyces variabilis]
MSAKPVVLSSSSQRLQHPWRLLVLLSAVLLAIAIRDVSAQGSPRSFAVPCSSSSSSCTARRNVPYFSTLPLDAPSSEITTAAVLIHGIDRDAATSFTLLKQIAAQAQQNNTLFLLAPRFQTQTDNPAATDLFWSGSGWADGLASVAPESVSAFTVLDAMFAQTAASFPNLKTLTVIGFSAGAQAVSRYAAFSQFPDTVAPRIQTRFIVADPGSFTYLTPSRAKPSSLSKYCGGAPQDCAAGLVNPSDFSDPYEGQSSAPGYDNYKYGLGARSQYPLQVGGSRSAVLSRFLTRDIRYYVGTDDTILSPELDMSPEANAQGSNRAVRMAVYVAYIKTVLHAPFSRLDFISGCSHKQDCVLTAGVVADGIFAASVTSSGRSSRAAFVPGTSSIVGPLLAAVRWVRRIQSV